MDKIPVIIDCDTGIDDMISFVLTLASKQLDIRGLTTVAGNVSLPHTTDKPVNGWRSGSAGASVPRRKRDSRGQRAGSIFV